MPRISGLPTGTAITDADLLAYVDGATTKHITALNAKTYFDSGGSSRSIVTPEDSGAIGNAVTVADLAVSSGDATATSASSTFTGRSGQVIAIAGAGAAGAILVTTILSVTNATTIELNTNASTTVSNAVATYGTDDTTALNTWLALASSSTHLKVTPGTRYLHNAFLVMDTKSDVLIDLRDAEFVATTQTSSAIKFIDVDTIEGYGGTFTVSPAPTSRGSTENHERFYMSGCSNIFWSNPSVVASHAAGILLLGCSYGIFWFPNIRDTKADGFHITGGSHHLKVISPVVSYVGDDFVAVVSYNTGDPICHHIDVISPRCRYQSSGRGVTVVGGEDVTFTDIDVMASAGAGVYVANESSFTSWHTSRVKVIGGRVSQANLLTSLDHGAVLVYNSINGTAITDVLVEGLEIRDTRQTAGASLLLKNGGSTGTMSGIVFKDLKLLGDRPETDYGADGGLSATTTNILHGEGLIPTIYKDTNYTLAITDAGDRIRMDSGSARTVTVPPNSSVAFPKGSSIRVLRNGSGTVTITAGAGVTLRYKDGQTGDRAIQGRYGEVEIWKLEPDEWVIIGDV